MAGNKKLSATIIIGGAVSSSLKMSIGRTQQALGTLGKTVRNLTSEQKKLGDSIKRMGEGAHGVDALRARYNRLGEAIERTKRAQERLTAASQRSERLNAIGGGMMKAGTVATAGAVAIGATLRPTLDEAKGWQAERMRIAALGMDEKTTAAAQHFAEDMKTYGTSRLENLTLVRDALSIFADLHHAEMVAPTLAKMKFANAAVFGEERGHDNERKFMDMLKVVELRGGTASKQAFMTQADMIQRVISATGGRVGPDEWRHLIATGGLAAKSMRDDAFYYQLEPLVQEMGGDRVGTGLMSAYSALYQGRTTKRAAMNLDRLGLIGDHSKVKHDKVGQTTQLNVGAIKGADIFRKSQYEWMKQVLIPTLAKKGITEKDDILDAIGSIYSNRKGADLMAAMYLQQFQIDKNEKLNRGAADIDTLDKIGRGSVAGTELDNHARLADLKLDLGNNILPMYTAALEKANAALVAMNGFVKENPGLTKAMVVGIGGVGVALAILGPALILGGSLVTAYSTAQLLAATRAAAATGAIQAQTIALGANGAAAATAGSRLLAFAKHAAFVAGGAFITDAAAGALGAGGKTIDQKQDDANWARMNWWQRIESGTGRAIEGAGRFAFMGNLANEAQAARIRDETAYFERQGRGKGKGPRLPERRGGMGPTISDSSTNTFHIVQQPGQNGTQLSQEVLDQWAKRHQGARSGGQLYDKPRGY